MLQCGPSSLLLLHAATCPPKSPQPWQPTDPVPASAPAQEAHLALPGEDLHGAIGQRHQQRACIAAQVHNADGAIVQMDAAADQTHMSTVSSWGTASSLGMQRCKMGDAHGAIVQMDAAGRTGGRADADERCNGIKDGRWARTSHVTAAMVQWTRGRCPLCRPGSSSLGGDQESRHCIDSAPVGQVHVDSAHVPAVRQAPHRLARHVEGVQLQVVGRRLQWSVATASTRHWASLCMERCR